LFTLGHYDQARELHFKLARLNQAISGVWGVAGVKAAMDIVGFKGGSPREPLRDVTSEVAESIKRQIASEGFTVR
jgi:4-hydroxy-2-oxoglutarate aldolase